jgi:hypothetical protein
MLVCLVGFQVCWLVVVVERGGRSVVTSSSFVVGLNKTVLIPRSERRARTKLYVYVRISNYMYR